MAATRLRYRLALHPLAVPRTNAAHGKTDTAGAPKDVASTLLGHERRDTCHNVVTGKTLPSSQVLGTSTVRFMQASGCNPIEAVARMLVIVDDETGEIISLEDALSELCTELRAAAARETPVGAAL